MAHQTISEKGLIWHHFSEINEADFKFLHENFKFHPLDFGDLREGVELPKIDVYKDYLFTVLNIPYVDVDKRFIGKHNLSIFISKNFVITATRDPVSVVDRFFARAKRSGGMRKEIFEKSSGFFLYKLLDYIFRDTKVILQELVRETNELEGVVYGKKNNDATKRLGMLRNNILFLGHVIDPQRIIISKIVETKRIFVGTDLGVYYDDIKDSLDGIWVVTNNLKNMVDSLFSVNEAFLTHRTNAIIRLLTLISVVLMPPTLITSYYGMNVANLPYDHDIVIVSAIVILSLVGFFVVIAYLDRRR